jgi:branched-chain amino acid transport system permease protein
MFLQLLANGIVVGLLYSFATMGFALAYNATRIFHIYYAALLIVAPYCFNALYVHAHINLFVSIILSVFIVSILSIIGEVVVYYPFQKKNRSHASILVSSLGLMTVLISIVALIWGNEVMFFNNSIGTARIGNINLSTIQLYQLIVSLVFILLLMLIIFKTKFGLYLRSHRDDEDLFISLGRNNKSFRILIFALSGLIAGISGLLYTANIGFEPYRGMPLFLVTVTALIIGGIGRYESPILGGLIIGVLQALIIGLISAQWQDAMVFVVLVLFLLLRPRGILGERNRVA